MKFDRRLVSLSVFVACAACAPAAFAQTPAGGLPTAPAADRAGEGGFTSSAASLPGPGQSPLEPYLITWLLPVSGIVCAVAGLTVARRLRAAKL
ncbi:MAG: hypothetical protein IAI50_12860 [Candidatus Eremiobacteraeota bacterium]|nr:hypothetical protein [Candidatus Eremiobacteraeota bacterium]